MKELKLILVSNQLKTEHVQYEKIQQRKRQGELIHQEQKRC